MGVPVWLGGPHMTCDWLMEPSVIVTWDPPSLNRQTDRTENITFLQLRWRAVIIHHSGSLVELTLRSPELQGCPPCSCAVVHALVLWRHLTDAPLCTLRSYSSQRLWTSWNDALDFPGKEMKMQVIGSIHKGESMIEGEKDQRTSNQVKGSNIEKNSLSLPLDMNGF